jgi:hypothetical protein
MPDSSVRGIFALANRIFRLTRIAVENIMS